MTKKQRGAVLRGIWLFEQCSNRELALLDSVLTAADVRAGRELARQGDDGREFVVIVQGKAEVTRDHTHVAFLGAGDFFGEMSLLDRQPRIATVTTVEPCAVLVMTVSAFNSVARSMPSVAHKMLVVLAQRLRNVEATYVPQANRVSTANIA